jgi:Flp pilus assembly secretin CpaC
LAISFGGFFTNTLKLMERIDAVAAAELIIILAVPALVIFLGEKAVSGSNQASLFVAKLIILHNLPQ